MFFKHNKNQVGGDVSQGKHKVTTKYYVRLDDGQYVAKNWYDDAVSQGTGNYWTYAMDRLEDAKQMQEEYSGTIYEEVSETYVRPYADDKVPSQHHAGVGKDDTWVTMDDQIKQLRNSGTSKPPHIEADMTIAELAKYINALKDASHSTPHIRIDIDTIDDYPRIYIDGRRFDVAIDQLDLNYIGIGKQCLDIRYFSDGSEGNCSLKHYKEETLNNK